MASKRISLWKTVFDRIAAGIGLLIFSPVLFACAAAVWLEDGGPVLFRQCRTGLEGRHFQLLKFRSMRTGKAGTPITVSKDPRITRVGAFLRRYKLDELPQLWNVLRGDMSLVGPRPELPAFVDLASRQWRSILSVRPGITDLASLVFRDEENVLSGRSDPQRYYREAVLPQKMALSISFLEASNFWLEFMLVACTIYYAVFPGRFDSAHVQRIFLRHLSPKHNPGGQPAIANREN